MQKILVLVLLFGLLPFWGGCGGGDSEGDLDLDTRSATTFDLFVGLAPSALPRGSQVRGQFSSDVTHLSVTLFTTGNHALNRQLIGVNDDASFFSLLPGEYFVRVEALDVNQAVVGYFDRAVNLTTELSTEITGLRLTTSPPTPNFQALTTGRPYWVFTGVPTDVVGATDFSVMAQAFDSGGNPLNSAITDVSLSSLDIAFDPIPFDEDSDASGAVEFDGLTLPATANGTTVLFVEAAGVDSAESFEVTATPL